MSTMINDFFFNLDYYLLSKEYKKIMEIKKNKQIEKYEKQLINNILNHSFNHVKYYRNVFENKLSNDEMELNYKSLPKIPLLTKEILQQNFELLKSEDINKRNHYVNYSGGSTGSPTKFIQDDIYKKWKQASEKYFYNQLLKVNFDKSKKLVLWGSPTDLFERNEGIKTRLSLYFTNTVLLNSFKLETKDIDKYIGKINDFRPDILRGYAGSLFELSKYARKKNKPLFTPKVIISSAENLTDEMRQVIESTFGARVHNFYGSRETASIAGECAHGLIHVFPFNNHVEIINKQGKPVKEGEMGKIIITNLHNYSMPFIRYEIGDYGLRGPDKCTCGQKGPTIKKLIGREEEQFIKKDGNVVIGYFFVHLLGVISNKGLIDKFQVIQSDYDQIVIKYVSKKIMPSSIKKDIEYKIKVVMGKDCNIKWNQIDKIEPSKNGKYFYTKSLIK